MMAARAWIHLGACDGSHARTLPREGTPVGPFVKELEG